MGSLVLTCRPTHVMITRLIFLSVLTALAAVKCSAFLPPTQLPSIRSSIICNKHKIVSLLNEKNAIDDGDVGINLDSFISSLPSPADVKENILEVRNIY